TKKTEIIEIFLIFDLKSENRVILLAQWRKCDCNRRNIKNACCYPSGDPEYNNRSFYIDKQMTNRGKWYRIIFEVFDRSLTWKIIHRK
ncbi:MAG: hypothetical protein K2P42_17230, partial [Lachnospiraceae bacterium]|nr:hypothetical protein [Lachnospiraceae bacterium]